MVLASEDRKEITEAASAAASKAAAEAVKSHLKEAPCHFTEEERQTFHELSRNIDAPTISRLKQIMKCEAVSDKNLPVFLSSLRIASTILNSAVKWIAIAILAAIVAGIMVGLHFITGGRLF